MAWKYSEDVDPATFDPEKEYTATELEAYGTAMLKEDRRQGNKTDILFENQIYERARKEKSFGDLTKVFNTTNKNRPGTYSGDGQAMFNRRHPEGRRVNSKEAREKHGAGYYR
jgi:hypothetical protein